MTGENQKLSSKELAQLIVETGEHHHQAYLESDGVDPEWALWYAGHLQTRMWDRAGTLPTRSQLVHLLLQGEADLAKEGSDTPWAEFYAEAILKALHDQ